MSGLAGLDGVLLALVVTGCGYSVACLGAVVWYLRRHGAMSRSTTGEVGGTAPWPAVSILKPVYGLEKHLERNLRSACELDHPEYQVVFAVQRLDDPALPLLRALEAEYGAGRVTVVAKASEPASNGKVQNLMNAYQAARHEIVLISDSDVLLRPDYLQRILGPFRDAAGGADGGREVGCVCTLYRAGEAQRWFEKLEQLSYNSEFIVQAIFAEVSGAHPFWPGCSMALRRSALDETGGFEPLLEYLAEDFELGRRITERGYRSELIPYFVDVTIDVERPRDWWHHQLYWDQNTRSVAPLGFFFTALGQPLPFALFFSLLRGFDAVGLGVLAGTLLVRIATRVGILWRIGDLSGIAMLPWLPLRDLAGFASWFLALFKRTSEWRDVRFGLTREGRIIPRA